MLFKDVTFSGGGFRYIPPQPTFLVNTDWGSFGKESGGYITDQNWSVMHNSNTNSYYIPSTTGIAYTSSDGSSWASQSNGVFATTQIGAVRSVAYNGTRYVAFMQDPGNNSDRGIIYSSDGNTWTRSNSSIANSATVGMIWSGSYFVSLNYNGGGSGNTFIWSTDGINWGNSTMGFPRPSTGSISFAANTAGNVVVAGQGAGSGAWYQRSTDGGQSFSGISYPGTGQDRGTMCFAAGAFVSPRTDNTIVFSSDNGLNWSQTGNIFPSSNGNINGLANNSSIVVAVLNSGGILTTPANNFPNISNNKWTSRTSGTTKNLNNVIYDGSKFIASGQDGIILNSSDGINWTTAKQPKLSANFTSPINLSCGIVNGNTIIFNGTNETNQMFTSADGGATWANSSIASGIVNSIMYDGSKFITGYQGNTLFTSTTGTNWTSTQISGVPTSGLITNLTYGSNSTNKYLFINGANACVSPNGNTGWDYGTIESGFNTAGATFKGAIYDGAKYVVIGKTGSNVRVGSSTEGTSWTMNTVDTSGLPYGIAFNGTRYVIVGINSINRLIVWTSTNLSTWTVATTPDMGTSLFTVVGYSETTSRFFAGSTNGRIITSRDGLSWVESSPSVARQKIEVISGDYTFSDFCILKFALV